MATESQEPESEGGGKSAITFRSLLVILFSAALVPVAFTGWKDLYGKFLERTPPSIILQTSFRGLGTAPLTLKLEVSDRGAGLDKVSVSLKQNAFSRELLPAKTLNALSQAEVIIDLPGRETGLEPGHATLVINAVDDSLWHNGKTEELTLPVDYDKPTLKLVSTPTRITAGNSGIVFYKVIGEEEVTDSGLIINTRPFKGYPARYLDAALGAESNLYFALFAAPLGQLLDRASLYAEDRVGNAVSIPIKLNLDQRVVPVVPQEVNEEYFRQIIAPLVEQNLGQLSELYGSPAGYPLKSAPGSPERIKEYFEVATGIVRQVTTSKVQGLLPDYRFARYWNSPFLLQSGRIESPFGTVTSFTFNGSEQSRTSQTGLDISLPHGDQNVLAAQDGIVVFSDNLPFYGRVVAIDHGLGLTSLYGGVETVTVGPGTSVKKGDPIALGGKRPGTGNNRFLFEVSIQGVPVDPREWTDRARFSQTVAIRINELKRNLGLPIVIE